MKKLAVLVLLCVPAPLLAQTSRTLTPYLASDGGVSGTPTLVGLTGGMEYWRVGMRLGAGIDSRLLAGPSAAELEVDPTRSWTADADALLFLGDRDDLQAVVPYAVVGAGMRALHGRERLEGIGTWSAGAGVRAPLLGPVALDGEIRYRQPLVQSEDQIPSGVRSGAEFRVALTYRMGSFRTIDARAPAPISPPRPVAPRPMPAPRSGGYTSAVVQGTLGAADQQLGIPYRWGGNTPSEGFDCSGFVRYVYAMHGINLPRVSRDQARAGMPLPLELRAFEPGDLLAFASNGTVVDHIAIYAGNGMIIHSSSSGGGVRYDDLNSRRGQWYLNHMVAARRVVGAEQLYLTQ